jgi:hypothetical protein
MSGNKTNIPARNNYLIQLIKEFDKLKHTRKTSEDEEHLFNLNREIVCHTEEEVKAAREYLRQQALQNTR